MNISIIVPLLNEEESLSELNAWIAQVMRENGFDYEVIYVDDGSKDDSWNVILSLSQEDSHVKGIRFQRNYGKSAALNEGFKAALGDVVITMDADLQDSPEELPQLYDMITDQGYDLVSGWKKKRYDNALTKNLPSKLYNSVTSRLTGIKLHDFNCGLKAYRKEVVKNIEVYGEMHRYIPVIAKKAGFDKIGEKVVQHQARKYGESKFGWERFINGFLDLISILFVGRFGKKPMHFFGFWGTIVFFIGFLLVMIMIISKIRNWDEYYITVKPAFYISLTLLVIGSQLFLAGFMSELISRNASDRHVYRINQKLRL